VLATSPDDTLRDGKEALILARQAHEIDHGQHANVTDTFACALAENGEFAQATDVEAQALKLAEAAQATAAANAFRTRLTLFANRLPYREPSPSP
jgi:hypothetical protein